MHKKRIAKYENTQKGSMQNFVEKKLKNKNKTEVF